MSTSKHQPSSNGSSSLRHSIAAAAAIVALLIGGLGVSGSHSDQTERLAGLQDQNAAAATQPASETVYFPSQYVNQGVETTEDWPTF